MEFYLAGLKDLYISRRPATCILFSGCNFRCHYCYNSKSLGFTSDKLARTADVRKLIDAGRDTICFGGGEPTIQGTALLYLMRHASNTGKRCILMTNGSRPDIVARASELGDIWLDLKAPLDETFGRITRSGTYFRSASEIIDDMAKTISFLRKSRAKVRVRTVIVPGMMYRKEDILHIAELVSPSWQWHLEPYIPVSSDKKLAGLRPHSRQFLHQLKEAVLKEFHHLDVRV